MDNGAVLQDTASNDSRRPVQAEHAGDGHRKADRRADRQQDEQHHHGKGEDHS